MNQEIREDLFRYVGPEVGMKYLVRLFFFTPSFRYVYLFRKTQISKNIFTKFFWKFLLRRCMLNTGIQIPSSTIIGAGLRIVHFGHIIVNPCCVIGKNFNIFPGVTLGYAGGKNPGNPIIGDNVVVSTNAVIVGGIKIGNDVLIAPNSFVNIDVPEGCIALGNPAIIIKKEKASAKHIVFSV